MSLSKLTNTQLQQKIIHLESELKKQKQLLEKYQNDYHYNLIDRLQAEKEVQEQQFIELEQQLNVEQTKYQNHQTKLSSIQNHYKKEIEKQKKENEVLTLQLNVEQTKNQNHQTELSSIQNHYKKETEKLKKENEALNLQLKNVQFSPHEEKAQSTHSQSKEVFPYLQNFNDAGSPKQTKEIENNENQNQNWFYRNFSKKQSEDK